MISSAILRSAWVEPDSQVRASLWEPLLLFLQRKLLHIFQLLISHCNNQGTRMLGPSILKPPRRNGRQRSLVRTMRHIRAMRIPKMATTTMLEARARGTNSLPRSHSGRSLNTLMMSKLQRKFSPTPKPTHTKNSSSSYNWGAMAPQYRATQRLSLFSQLSPQAFVHPSHHFVLL